MSINEKNSVQAPLVDRLVGLGWTHVPGAQLDRQHEQGFVESDLVAALRRLNPLIDDDPDRATEVISRLRAVALGVVDDGLVATNRTMTSWLRGLESVKFAGEAAHSPIRLVDFDHPASNTLVVSDEVSYGTPSHKARFDIVLWVNGIPLVVGETKTATNALVSWLNAVSDVVEVYQPTWPGFFAPNVFCFGTEGKVLMVGPTGAPVDAWAAWGPAKPNPTLPDMLDDASTLLSPATVLTLLRDYLVFEEPQDNRSGLRKLMARYMQFDAVERITARAHEGSRRRGLIYHTQGTGKTLAMVFAAAKVLTDPALNNPTVILVADRVQLVRQTWDQFKSAGLPRLSQPGSTSALQRALGDHAHGGADQRGLIFSTVHKFAGAPAGLNTRSNIVVLVDEAHRTQEGNLGQTLRDALPNAFFFAFTGTPIATLDRNTYATFGDPDDENKALHSYTSDQAIADGVVVPIHVQPRLVEFTIDKTNLDEAFAELAAEEQLEDDEKQVLARRATRVSTFFANPERIEKVCADIVDHFYSTVDPLGMKAQVVVFDRQACVDYVTEIGRLLAEREAAGHQRDEAAVVMTVSGKDDDPAWQQYSLTDTDEEALLKRYRTFGDPLKFVVVTSKLGTGFNAPIEGVMYLDKPLRDHTLFQAITRTNRTWKNPDTGQEKRYGLVVDYVGLGAGFAKAMAPANPDQEQRELEVDGLIDAFEAELKVALLRFAGIDHTTTTATTLLDALGRLPDAEAKRAFGTQFRMLEGIWETVHPHTRLHASAPAYKFLAKVFEAAQPPSGAAGALWARLGAKTLALVHEHLSQVTITRRSTLVVADAETIRRLEEQDMLPDVENPDELTADQIIDSIAARLKKRQQGPTGDHAAWKSLAERLDELRSRQVKNAQDSIDLLSTVCEVATDFRRAEKADDQDGRAGLDLLPDPNQGALTQIFHEYAPPETPETIEKVVLEVDAIVKQVRFDNWAKTQKGDQAVRRELRKVLGKYQLHEVVGLFDQAYAYIHEHY